MFKKILIPVDVSGAEETQKLLTAAKSLTAGWACELHVVSVIPNMGMPIVGSYFEGDFEAESRSSVDKELAKAVATAGIDAQIHVLTGTVYDRVITHANELGTDLIVIGAHQPELRDYLLGSNAARVVRHSNCSVLVMRDTA